MSFSNLNIMRLMTNSSNFKITAGILFHLISIILIYFLAIQIGWVKHVPDHITLLKWDAVWYNEIMQNGYSYVQGAQNTTAFFPMFSALWGAFQLDALGISILNLLILYIAFFLIGNKLKFNFYQILFLLSTPLLFFCYVPYSESLFFLGGTFLIIGIDSSDQRLLMLGLIICSATRSVGMIFIPALIFSYILSEQNYSFKSLTNNIKPIGAIILVTLLIFIVQYLHTGEWFVFFETQKAWHRQLRLPVLPFASGEDFYTIWLDLSSLFIGYLAISWLSKLMLQYIFQNRSRILYARSKMFSMSYIALITIISILFSGVWEGDSGTKLMSLPRFIFASPFFIYIAGLLFKYQGIKHDFFLIVGSLVITFLSYHAIILNHPYYIAIISLYIILYFFVKKTYIVYTIIVINLLLQVILLDRFLSEIWIS